MAERQVFERREEERGTACFVGSDRGASVSDREPELLPGDVEEARRAMLGHAKSDQGVGGAGASGPGSIAVLISSV